MDNAEEIDIPADICGPFQTRMIGVKRCLLGMTYRTHRYTELQLLERRTEAGSHTQKRIAWPVRATVKAVKRIYAENAKEFICFRSAARKRHNIDHFIVIYPEI